jgi:hypothetical protein
MKFGCINHKGLKEMYRNTTFFALPCSLAPLSSLITNSVVDVVVVLLLLRWGTCMENRAQFLA